MLHIEIDFEDALLPFEDYFHRRANVADQLADLTFSVDAKILATTALNALAKIWLHDFPAMGKELQNRYGGGLPESIRLSQLLRHFAKDDPEANNSNFVCFTEDWKLFRPEDSALANQLLDKRLSNDPHQSPMSSLDLPLADLEQECPQITKNLKLRRLAEEYQYGALLYKFYRCPLVHSSKASDRTHGFVCGERIMYYKYDIDPDRTTIGFGLNLITRWLRIVATNYVQLCREQAVITAKNLNASSSSESNLKNRWRKL